VKPNKEKKTTVKLPPEQYSKAENYLGKIKEADSVTELKYYYSKFKSIIESSQKC
jgi:hypothetical protein